MLQSFNYEPNVIVLSETWLCENNKNNATIPGYSAVHVVREGSSGGVSIFYRDCLHVEVFEDLSVCNASIEACSIRILLDGTYYYYIGVYRPCRGSVQDFVDAMTQLLASLGHPRGKKVFILGDFNVNLLSEDAAGTVTLVNFMKSSHFLPTVTTATRFNPHNVTHSSILDHIWINFTDVNYQTRIILSDQTDHYPVIFEFEKNTDMELPVKIMFRDQSNAAIEKFRLKLRLVQWNFSGLDINEAILSFNNKIENLFKKCFPLKSKIMNNKSLHNPWVTPGILNSIKTKSKYFKLYKQGLISKERNDRFNKTLNKVIRSAKRRYFFNYFETNIGNIKKTWAGIRKLTGNVIKKNCVKTVEVNGEQICNEQEIADCFNNYFTTIAHTLNSDIPALSYRNPTNISTISNSFYLSPINSIECERIISSLNNTSYGVNTMSCRILKKVKDILADPLCTLINLSFSTGVFPDSLKKARITPIHKSGDRKNICNYRPISVLPLLSKLFEKCMSLKLTTFFDKYSCITPNQFGFLKGKSCFDAVSSLTEYVYSALNSHEYVASVFIDLRKAYDTVNHEILLKKLSLSGVRGVQLKWFASYLENRSQCVAIGNHVSSYSNISIGVPQGSVLGSLLFLIYINDLPSVSDKLSVILYADDTVLSFSHPNFENMIQVLTCELEKVNNWLIMNKLSLNVSKTVAINFSKRKIPYNSSKISINNISLQFSDRIKYLGIIIDCGLTFRYHVDKVCSSVSKTIGVLYRLSANVPKPILFKLYYALIYPYLIYCNIIWGGCSEVHLNKILLFQKKAVRLISGADFYHHSNPLFIANEILKIQELYKYCCSIFVHKYRNRYMVEGRRYTTRNSNALTVQYQRLCVTQRSIFFILPKIYNELPLEITSESSLHGFKNKTKKFFMNSYSTV